MKKMASKRIIQILLILGTIISLYFVPWPIVNAWIKPLPDTVQEQVAKATDYGFDGYNWNMSEIMYDRIVKILKKTE